MSNGPISETQKEFKLLGTSARGLVQALPGDLPNIRFSNEPGGKYFKSFDMSDDLQRKMYEAALETKSFERGLIFKVKSAKELEADEKKAKQRKKLDFYLNAIHKEGMAPPNYKEMDFKKLCGLADSIGANWVDKNGNPSPHVAIVKNITELLELDREPVTETVIEKPKVPRGRRKGVKNA